jgi:hypothetical protein
MTQDDTIARSWHDDGLAGLMAALRLAVPALDRS